MSDTINKIKDFIMRNTVNKIKGFINKKPSLVPYTKIKEGVLCTENEANLFFKIHLSHDDFSKRIINYRSIYDHNSNYVEEFKNILYRNGICPLRAPIKTDIENEIYNTPLFPESTAIATYDSQWKICYFNEGGVYYNGNLNVGIINGINFSLDGNIWTITNNIDNNIKIYIYYANKRNEMTACEVGNEFPHNSNFTIEGDLITVGDTSIDFNRGNLRKKLIIITLCDFINKKDVLRLYKDNRTPKNNDERTRQLEHIARGNNVFASLNDGLSKQLIISLNDGNIYNNRLFYGESLMIYSSDDLITQLPDGLSDNFNTNAPLCEQVNITLGFPFFLKINVSNAGEISFNNLFNPAVAYDGNHISCTQIDNIFTISYDGENHTLTVQVND